LSDRVIKRAGRLQGCPTIPGDKSISHRAAILSLLCRETIEARNFAPGDDCARSLGAVEMVGGKVDRDGAAIRLTPPTSGIMTPAEPIDCGNSGTTMRLLAGLLCGAGVPAILIGDPSLSSRPMNRIVEPLRMMNAAIDPAEGGTAPLVIGSAPLIPIDYTLPVASAQVKSCLLLAGLASRSEVILKEKVLTRDHTERMVNHLGGRIEIEDVTAQVMQDPDDPRKKKRVVPTEEYKRKISLSVSEPLRGGVVDIPGDISTAAYFIAAAMIVPGSHLILKNVGLNPTRAAFLNLLRQMGANITIKNRTIISGEPAGDIEVTHSKLKPRRIGGNVIANVIDEIPMLAVLAAFLEGTSIIRDAGELRHKESDRLAAIAANLTAMGVKVGEFPDGLAIEGTGEVNGADVDSFGDHRIAMAFAVAGLGAHGQTIIKNSQAVSVSCPEFFAMLDGLRVA
jgi:3-phosphoshikimate 1-carboxyvinyltransferase